MTEEQSGFKKWYEKNKEDLAERRRKKYAEDEEYRNKALQRSRQYYWLSRRRADSLTRKQIDVEAAIAELGRDDCIEDIVTDENDVRYGLPIRIPVYGIGVVAKYFDRTVQTVRLWFLRKYLPEPTYRDTMSNRIFTEDEFRILLEYRHWLELSSKSFAQNPFFLKVNEEWARLGPEGIEVMPKSRWRLVDELCPWCDQGKGLQYLQDDVWEFVPCFDCVEPMSRERFDLAKMVVVKGVCPNCQMLVEEEVQDKERIILLCQRCGTKIVNFEREEIE